MGVTFKVLVPGRISATPTEDDAPSIQYRKFIMANEDGFVVVRGDTESPPYLYVLPEYVNPTAEQLASALAMWRKQCEHTRRCLMQQLAEPFPWEAKP